MRFVAIQSKFRVLRRVAAVGLLLPFVVAVLATPSNAQTAPVGVGTGNGAGSVLTVDLGSLLRLSLVNELSDTTTDPAKGNPLALSQLQLLQLQSSLVPGLDSLTVPLVETRSTGAEDRKDTALLDLASLGLPANLLTGQITPAVLSSIVGGDGALSSLTTSLDNIAVLGGLLKTDAAAALLGSTATPASSTASRGLSINQLTALDLGGLLQLLGIRLDQLPLTTVTNLVSQLGIPLSTVSQATGLPLGSLNDLSNLGQVVGGLLSQPCNQANAIIQLLNLVCNNLPASIGTTQNALQGLLDLVGGTALLDVQGIQIGQEAVAATTLDASSATTTGSIGKIRVGGIDLGAIDLNQALDQIVAVATQATNTLNGLLATIDPALGNLIQIKLFDRFANVAPDGSYTTALSGITALQVTVAPPDVCAILGRLNVPNTVNGVLAGLGVGAVTVPTQLADLLNSLTSNVTCPAPLGAVTAALTQPLTVKALSVSGAANFALPGAPGTPGTPGEPVLPRTGTEGTLFLLLGAGMVIVAVGLRRLHVHRI